MKALTLTQPWAWCITDQGKRVENRRWDTRHRGRLAVHAGAKPDAARIGDMNTKGWALPTELPTSAIVAVCDLIEVHPARGCCGRWAEQGAGVYHWVLDTVQKLPTPIPCKGAQRLWTVPGHIRI